MSGYVYRELLGLDAEECARLESVGHIATTYGPEVLGRQGEGGDTLLTNWALPAIMETSAFAGSESLAGRRDKMIAIYLTVKAAQWIWANRPLVSRYFWKILSLAKHLYFIVWVVEKLLQIIG